MYGKYIYIMCFLPLLVVTVGLEQTNYSVVEGESVEVCVVLVEGTLERNVFITLSSNATGERGFLSV